MSQNIQDKNCQVHNQHNKKNIAVIGAGIVGINCALSLQSQGYQVTLIDKEGIAAGCSYGNAGHFATEQVFPLAETSLLWQLPKLLLDPLGPMALSPRYFPKALPWFLRFMANMPTKVRNRNSEAIKSLNRSAIDYYQPLLKEAEAEHLLIKQGSLLVYENTPLAEVKKQWQHYFDAGIPVKLIDSEQVKALEPNLSKNINYALYFTDVAHTSDPAEICKELAQLSFTKGTIFKQLTITQIEVNETEITISDKNESMVFDQLVMATGAWSKNLLAKLGYKLPLEVERGYSLDLPESIENTSQNASPSLSRPVASAERKFIMTPMAHGLRLSGTVEFAGLEQKPNYKRADMLYQHAKNIVSDIVSFDGKTATDDQRWLGFRPSLPDSLPVICKATKHERLFFALGHQHLGLTQGAITGKLISQIVEGIETDIDISPFCISRFN
jgi:D-amino-acid dehydrogenase